MAITEGRRCEYSKCNAIIPPEPDGRPQRRYCNAEHRAEARRERREAARRAATSAPFPPRKPMPDPRERRHRLAKAAARWCRAAAVLGSAGLLVSGSGLMAASTPIGNPRAAAKVAPWTVVTPEAEQQWALEAQVTLASLDTQLQEVTKAEESWKALPESLRPDFTPAPIRALTTRKALLQQQRTTLASELATWRSMRDADRRLAETESHVANLERAIDQVPKNRKLSRAESEIAHQLSEERKMRVRLRNAQRQEVANLRQGLRKAMETPLPRDEETTRAITQQVAELIKNPRKHRNQDRNPLTGQPTRPEVIAPRDREDPRRKDIGNGAPPHPGRNRPEILKRPDVLAAPPTRENTGTLGGTLDGATQKLPKLEAPQGGAPPAGVPTGKPKPNQPGILNGGVDGLAKQVPGLGNRENPNNQGGLLGQPHRQPGQQPHHQPGQRPAPERSGPLGEVLASPTRPLEGQSANPLNRPAGQADIGRSGAERRRGTLADQPVTRPVERVSKDSFIGPTSSEPASKSEPSGPSGHRRSAPIPRPQPQTSLVPGESEGGTGSGEYTDRDKMRDAARITRAMSDGDMGDVVAAAMAAKAREKQAERSGGSSGSSSHSGDAVDRALAEYGIEDSPSSSSGKRRGSKRSGSSSGSGDVVDQALAEYGIEGSSTKRGGSKRGKKGHGSSSFGGSDIDRLIDSYVGDRGGSGKSNSGKSSKRGKKHGKKGSSGFSSGDIDRLIDKFTSGGSKSKKSSGKKGKHGKGGGKKKKYSSKGKGFSLGSIFGSSGKKGKKGKKGKD